MTGAYPIVGTGGRGVVEWGPRACPGAALGKNGSVVSFQVNNTIRHQGQARGPYSTTQQPPVPTKKMKEKRGYAKI